MNDPDQRGSNEGRDGRDGGEDSEGREARRAGGEPEQASLGILFIAAALGLGVVLTVVGLLAFAVMSR